MRTGTRSDVAETEHVQVPATTGHGRQTRHVVSPLIAIERVEQPAIEHRLELSVQDRAGAGHRPPRSQRPDRDPRPSFARSTRRSASHRLPGRPAPETRCEGRSRPSRSLHRERRRRMRLRPRGARSPAVVVQCPRAQVHRGTTHPRAGPPAARDWLVGARAWDRRSSMFAPHQKSSRMTTRRNVGRLTSVKPASANTPSVPTWSSSEITFFVVMG